ncbi:hypothetical protein PG990_007529 [Apiospora arundinis]
MASQSRPNTNSQRVTDPMSAPTNATTQLSPSQGDEQLDHDGEVNNSPRQSAVSPPLQHSGFAAQQKGATLSRPSNIEEDPRFHNLPDKVDSLSTDVKNLQVALKELQQNKSAISAPDERLRRDLETARDSLQQEQQARVTLQSKLDQVRQELQQATMMSNDLRKKWKKAASELSQPQSHGAGPGQYHFPDSELTNEVLHLRFEVRNFSEQYFTAKRAERSDNASNDSYLHYMLETTFDSRDYRKHLKSEKQGSKWIQSFLWRLLVGEIFEKFHWVPEVQKSMSGMYKALQPATRAPEFEQRFQIWKATTSMLLVECMKHSDEQVQREVQANISWIAAKALNVIRPSLEGSDSDLQIALQSIIHLAINLDRHICQLSARYDWCFPPPCQTVQFDPEFMQVGTGEVQPLPVHCVGAVVAPALTKRGKQTGEDFGVEIIMLKMEVTCMPRSSFRQGYRSMG